jgi:amino acid permease
MKTEMRGVAVIVGTVIGAGTLGLPFVFYRAGFLVGLGNLVLVGIMSTLTMLYTTEIVLRTKKAKQMPGIAEIYLGKKGKTAMMVLQVIGIYGALMAYLIGIGASLESIFGANKYVFSTIFLLLAIFPVYKGLKVMEKLDFLFSPLKLGIILVLCLFLLPSVQPERLSGLELSRLFLPYGVLMFAFSGYTVIPNLERVMSGQKKKMKRVIMISMLICFLVYLLFSTAFVGSQTSISGMATEGLEGNLGVFGNIAALFLLVTPFLILGWVLKDIFMADYSVKRGKATFFACGIPFILMFLARPTFTMMLEISGGYAISMTYILTAMMVKKAREKGDDVPEFVVPFGNWPLAVLIIMGLTGTIYTTMSLFGLW